MTGARVSGPRGGRALLGCRTTVKVAAVGWLGCGRLLKYS